MSSHGVRCALLCLVPLLAAACDGVPRGTTTSLAPSALPSASFPPSNGANFLAAATVLSVTNPGHACGWGTSTGATRTGVSWRITVTGGSISLDEDMGNWPTDDIPFTGALDGRQFTATYSQGDNYLGFVCQFKGGTLTGSFSDDFSSFEASETLVWGPPGAETTVQRRWAGSRL